MFRRWWFQTRPGQPNAWEQRKLQAAYQRRDEIEERIAQIRAQRNVEGRRHV